MVQWITNLVQRWFRRPTNPSPNPKTITEASPLLNRLKEPVAVKNDVIPIEDIIRQMDEMDAKIGLVKIPEQSIIVFNEFAKRHRGLVYRFMLNKIGVAVKTNASNVLLFRMGNTPRIAKIERSGFSKALNDMIAWFSEHEEYEHAARAVGVLRQHEVNAVLESTKKG